MLLTLVKISPIYFSCIVYDYLLKNDVFVSLAYSRWLKVLCDEIGHGVIAALSWVVVVNYDFRYFLQIVLSGFFGVVIDVDHFISAKSWSLMMAGNLPDRPFLHNSVILVILVIICIFILYIKKQQLIDLALILFVSVSSHHLRDANRRGMWFGHFGSTRVIAPGLLYASLICFIAIFVGVIRRRSLVETNCLN
ncbi:transmembrane protein 267-like [Hydra vulgaris]|uniref:Transmembrane protein 267 n=1 Tax=Hydra vulgaris TaxID=6087 RepID=A0ABM4C8T3_HYDVU